MRLACLAAEPLAPSQAELERAHEAERARALADLLDRLSARLGSRAVTRRELIDAHLPEQAEAAAPATLGRGARCAGRGVEPSRPAQRRAAGAAAPAVRPARADRGARRSARRPALALPLAARPARRRRHRGAGAHRRPLVAARRRADARLFPRRGFPRPPLLALSRRSLGPRDGAGEMVPAWGVRVMRALLPASGRRRPAKPAGRGCAARGAHDEEQAQTIGAARCALAIFAKAPALKRCAPSRRKRRKNSGVVLRDRRLQALKFRASGADWTVLRRLRLPSIAARHRDAMDRNMSRASRRRRDDWSRASLLSSAVMGMRTRLALQLRKRAGDDRRRSRRCRAGAVRAHSSGSATGEAASAPHPALTRPPSPRGGGGKEG